MKSRPALSIVPNKRATHDHDDRREDEPVTFRAILLVVPDDDPDRLTQPGPCGSRPPVGREVSQGVWQLDGEWWLRETGTVGDEPVAFQDPSDSRTALVLAHQQYVLRRGCEPFVEAMEKCDESPSIALVVGVVSSALQGIRRDIRRLDRWAAMLGCTIVSFENKGAAR